MEQKMVEVFCMVGHRCRLGDQRGTVKRLLREGDERPRVVALVYWDGGRMSFEYEKDLCAVLR
jgi:hypothetical protein